MTRGGDICFFVLLSRGWNTLCHRAETRGSGGVESGRWLWSAAGECGLTVVAVVWRLFKLCLAVAGAAVALGPFCPNPNKLLHHPLPPLPHIIAPYSFASLSLLQPHPFILARLISVLLLVSLTDCAATCHSYSRFTTSAAILAVVNWPLPAGNRLTA